VGPKGRGRGRLDYRKGDVMMKAEALIPGKGPQKLQAATGSSKKARKQMFHSQPSDSGTNPADSLTLD